MEGVSHISCSVALNNKATENDLSDEIEPITLVFGLGDKKSAGSLNIDIRKDEASVIFATTYFRFTTYCYLNYHKFPFDTVICTAMVSTPLFLRNNTSGVQVLLQWNDKSPVRVISGTTSGQSRSILSSESGFKISGVETMCRLQIVCYAMFSLKRHYTYYTGCFF